MEARAWGGPAGAGWRGAIMMALLNSALPRDWQLTLPPDRVDTSVLVAVMCGVQIFSYGRWNTIHHRQPM